MRLGHHYHTAIEWRRLALTRQTPHERRSTTSSLFTSSRPSSISVNFFDEASRSEEHTSALQSHSDLHSFPTRRSSDLALTRQTPHERRSTTSSLFTSSRPSSISVNFFDEAS